MVPRGLKNLEGSRCSHHVLNSSAVERVYRGLVLTILEQLERRLDELRQLGLVLGQKVRNSYAGKQARTFHSSDFRT